ncbi:conserved hypothetical protein [Marinobacter salarius]|uniref:hypothetical protein n=1 Tax=Marinobacter salarius TaxID=1420917 RepID=UPI001256630D|nr:hypothetical protein [Marinobacter salarius]VVT32452.1 conserved hypothetical protein [Marinobacter salarius]VXA92758.1 conserved hypothetical protein [Marinobacter salarius]
MLDHIKRLAVVTFGAVILSGCATQTINTSFTALPSDDSMAYFSEGWIIQKQESKDYVVQMAVRDGKQAWDAINGLLFVQNKSEEPINVDVENISFQQDEYSIDLLSYNELTQQHISRAQSRRTALALSAMAQSFSAAGPQTTTTYGSGTAYGSGGTASYYGTTQSYTYDPSANAAAQAQIQANVQSGVSNIQSDLQRNLDSMDGYLQKTTVFPGQTYSGRFQSQMTRFDQRPESVYALTVELGGETFSFKFVEEADIQTHQRKLF